MMCICQTEYPDHVKSNLNEIVICPIQTITLLHYTVLIIQQHSLVLLSCPLLYCGCPICLSICSMLLSYNAVSFRAVVTMKTPGQKPTLKANPSINKTKHYSDYRNMFLAATLVGWIGGDSVYSDLWDHCLFPLNKQTRSLHTLHVLLHHFVNTWERGINFNVIGFYCAALC